MRGLWLAVVAAAAMAPPAQADDLERCTVLSFAPLDMNLPACDRLIDAGDLSGEKLAEAYAARAEARLWAMTYHHGHEVEPRDLMRAALADLDRAVALDLRYLGARGEVQYGLGRYRAAVDDFTAAIEAAPADAVSHLVNRSYAVEALGERGAAIDDMTEVIRLTEPGLGVAAHLTRRAELREASGEKQGAVEDYREVLRLDPGQVGAREALERLGASP